MTASSTPGPSPAPSKTDTRLAGRVALVTGGAQGIGAAIADRLAAAGATVVIGDLRPPATSSAGERVPPETALDDGPHGDAPDGGLSRVDPSGGDLLPGPPWRGGSSWVHLDVTDEASVEAGVAEIVARHGRLDIVVNNAGIMFEGDLDGHDVDRWQKMVAVNLTGPFLVSRAAVGHLKTNGGAIVNVGSIEGFCANPGHAAYAATKAGVHGLTVALAVDLGPYGVRVNAVAPGWIDTELNASFVNRHPDRDEVTRQLAALHPVGHVGAPSDVGDVVVWLASDESRFVTGQIITIDGGRLAKPPLPPILSE